MASRLAREVAGQSPNGPDLDIDLGHSQSFRGSKPFVSIGDDVDPTEAQHGDRRKPISPAHCITIALNPLWVVAHVEEVDDLLHQNAPGRRRGQVRIEGLQHPVDSCATTDGVFIAGGGSHPKSRLVATTPMVITNDTPS